MFSVDVDSRTILEIDCKVVVGAPFPFSISLLMLPMIAESDCRRDFLAVGENFGLISQSCSVGENQFTNLMSIGHRPVLSNDTFTSLELIE